MKIKITEAQLNRLKKTINEDINYDSDKYRRDVTFRVHYKGLYKGYEINDISNFKIPLLFNINLEYKSWGINGISIDNLIGPPEITTVIDYATDNVGGYVEEEITIKVDWSDMEKILIDKENGSGILTIDDEAEISLIFGEDGTIEVRNLELKYLTV